MLKINCAVLIALDIYFHVDACHLLFLFFFLNDPPPTEIYPLPLHAALPILGPSPMGETAALGRGRGHRSRDGIRHRKPSDDCSLSRALRRAPLPVPRSRRARRRQDRKSTRLNSSHLVISYAVFCLKKKKNIS